MNFKRHIITLGFTLFLINYCQSQNIIRRNVPQHQIWRNEILPKIKAKIDSLYPNATNVHVGDRSRVSDSTQVVFITCNCPEGSGMYITFDTNGNILNKDISISIKDLPDTISSYMKTNYSKGYRYDFSIHKNITSKGEVTYRVSAIPVDDGRPKSGSWVYILKFKATGEYISTEKRWQNI